MKNAFDVNKMEQKNNECIWHEYTFENGEIDFDYWQSTCGEVNAMIVGSPSENRYVYCPYCGRQIKEVPCSMNFPTKN